MIKSIFSMLIMFGVLYAICYYFAPSTTTSLLHYIGGLIQGNQGKY